MASCVNEVKPVKIRAREDKQAEAGKGEISRLKAVYGSYADRVYTLCLRLLADAHAAAEASVQVFVQFSREINEWSYDPRTFERVRELAIKEALLRLHTKDYKTGSITTTRLPLSVNTGRDSPPPLNKVMLDVLTSQLPDSLRIAFVLRDREGLSDEAVAAYLGVSQAEARRLIHHARLELRRL